MSKITKEDIILSWNNETENNFKKYLKITKITRDELILFRTKKTENYFKKYLKMTIKKIK